MSIEVKVPVLPESVSDAVIATWHKKPGDTVRRDENLVDLETDKVVLEVPCPADGTLESIEREAGDTVVAGELLAAIAEGDVGSVAFDDAADDETTHGDDGDDGQDDSGHESGALSPSAKRLAAENNVDPAAVKGSGRDGRVTKEDVQRHIDQGDSKSRAAPAAKPIPAASADAPAPAGARETDRVPMTRLRKRIAERMIEAQSEAAMLTSFNEVNLRTVMDIRSQYKESFQKKHGAKLGFMSFFVKACCEALRKYPVVNAAVDGGDVIYHGYCDVGIAVSTDRGLMVPVLRSAEQMTLAEIESGIAGFAGQARSGTIRLEDLQGGTFTITNGGVFGSLVSTPILNRPQSAILGMHAIKERPIVENGEIVAAPMMYIALTYDHRIIDGRDAVLFLVAVKEALEDPHRMLLNL